MIPSWQESYDKARQCFKSKNLTLPTEVCIVKAMLFPVACMHVRAGQTIKNAQCEELMFSSCDAVEDS